MKSGREIWKDSMLMKNKGTKVRSTKKSEEEEMLLYRDGKQKV